jgi:hypothetical protein
MRGNESRWFLWVVLAAAAAVVAAALYSAPRRRPRAEPSMPPPVAVAPEAVDPWKEAALKAEEERGEPAGRQAAVEIPPQLRHGSDRRRFLGVQVAEWRRHEIETPHDYADLVRLIRRGELVEAPSLGADFILYGVGYSATDEPFTHYDRKTDRSVTLYAGAAELRQEREQLAESRARLTETIEGLQKESAALPRRERERRKEFDEQLREERRRLAEVRRREQLLREFYGTPARRAALAAEYEELASLARDFGGRTYDLQDAAARKRFKERLLSFVRPAALRVMEEVARAYRARFERHLPFTSLVRTDEYQRRLNETNPNATLIDVPPHTTGLAFDIYYRYLTAAEQEFVMAELARLSDEGRVEALRELRDHYHVFAFAEGTRPAESLIRETLGDKAGPKKPAAEKKPAAQPKAQPKRRAAARRKK